MKKVISLVLVVVMLYSTFAGLQITSHAHSSSGSCGKNVTYTFDSATGLLTISGSGAMTNYYWSNDYDETDIISPFYHNSNIKSIVVNNGVTSIGSRAFDNCTGLTSITIPESVTSIDYSAFYGCSSLTSVHISDLSAWCKISFGSSTLINAHDLYLKGEKITEMVIPDSVTSIGDRVFDNCSGITSITIPDSVTSIGDYAFYNCSGLTSITIPDSVTSLGKSAFCKCETLSNVKLSKALTVIPQGAFSCCYSLKKVIIPDSVKTIDVYAFQSCKNLKELTIPASVSIRNGYCYWYSAIDEYYDGEYPPAFEDCTNIETITFTEGTGTMAEYYKDKTAQYNFYGEAPWYYSRKSIKKIVIEEGVKNISDYTFCDCDGMKAVTIPSSVKSIGECAFNSCTELKDVFYSGSPTQWLNLMSSVAQGNEALLSAKVHYYHNAKFLATFQCTERTATAQKVEWNEVAGATGYQVQISTKDGRKWATTATLKAGVTNYTFKKLAAGNNYKFRIRIYIEAEDGEICYSLWSAPLNSPTSPAGTTLTKLTPAKKAFTAQWKKNAAVTGYQLQYGVKSNFSGAKTLTVKNAKTLKAAVKKLSAKKTYYVRIRTYKTISKVNYFSSWSKAYKVKTK